MPAPPRTGGVLRVLGPTPSAGSYLPSRLPPPPRKKALTRLLLSFFFSACPGISSASAGHACAARSPDPCNTSHAATYTDTHTDTQRHAHTRAVGRARARPRCAIPRASRCIAGTAEKELLVEFVWGAGDWFYPHIFVFIFHF